MKNIIITLVVYLQTIGLAIGCECNKVSYTFMDGIKPSTFVAMVEVIRKDTVSSAQSGPMSEYSFTVVKILKQYSGKHLGQEIRIIDAKGFECFTKLHYKSIGEKFIVKGFIEDINEHIFVDWDKQLPNENILVLGLCSMNQLKFENNNVIGQAIQHSSYQRSKCNIFLKKISFGLIDREKKECKEFEPQQMNIEKFERKLSKAT